MANADKLPKSVKDSLTASAADAGSVSRDEEVAGRRQSGVSRTQRLAPEHSFVGMIGRGYSGSTLVL